MKPKIKLIGMGLLIENFRKLGVGVKYQVEQEMIRMGLGVQNKAKAYCPVLTGRLRASTTTNWSHSGIARKATKPPAKPNDGVGQPSGKGFQVAVGTNVIYSEPVHKRVPYLRAAYNEVEKVYIKKLELAMAKGLNAKL